jgi:hypothetical protein
MSLCNGSLYIRILGIKLPEGILSWSKWTIILGRVDIFLGFNALVWEGVDGRGELKGAAR